MALFPVGKRFDHQPGRHRYLAGEQLARADPHQAFLAGAHEAEQAAGAPSRGLRRSSRRPAANSAAAMLSPPNAWTVQPSTRNCTAGPRCTACSARSTAGAEYEDFVMKERRMSD